MLIRKTPKDLEKYILVDDSTSLILHKSGFTPIAMDCSGTYYLKTYDIVEFMLERGLTKVG